MQLLFRKTRPARQSGFNLLGQWFGFGVIEADRRTQTHTYKTLTQRYTPRRTRVQFVCCAASQYSRNRINKSPIANDVIVESLAIEWRAFGRFSVGFRFVVQTVCKQPLNWDVLTKRDNRIVSLVHLFTFQKESNLQ